jgi:hypothetical protein
MERTPVKSSNVASIGYHEPTKKMEVEFHGKSGKPNMIYVHYGIEPQMHADFMAADSIGSFYNQNIRGKFNYKRLEPEQKKE